MKGWGRLNTYWVLLCAFLLSVFIAGCASGPLLTAGDSPSDKAAETLARVEVGLTIGYQFVEQEAAKGVFTKIELFDILMKLDAASGGVTKAQELRRKGLFADSLREALQSESLLTAANELLANRIRKQRGESK